MQARNVLSSNLRTQSRAERGDGFDDAVRIGKIKIGVQKHSYFYFCDPYGNRTHVTAVKGPCLNRLTNGPDMVAGTGLEPVTYRV